MSQVYKEMSLKFSIYIDTFSYISKKSRLFDENDALALYELLKVDSELAKQKLAQMGASLKSAKF
jgi:hypothetical protein